MPFRGPLVAALLTGFATGCVTAGPIPGMTFTTSTPDPRAQVEVTAALVPGFYLSDAVVPLAEDRTAYGSLHPQVSGFIDPGRALGELGLSIGGRLVGGAGGYLEPMLRYRRSFGEERRFGLALTAGGTYGAYSDPDHPPLELTLAKGTLEAAGDLRLTPAWWLELHALAGASVSVLSASGKWCAAPSTGGPQSCPELPRTGPILVGTSTATGAFPAAYAGLAVDLGRSWTGVFHHLRLAAAIAGGNLPKVAPLPVQPTLSADTEVAASPAPRAWWGMFGLSLTVALGQGAPEGSHPAEETSSAAPAQPGVLNGRVMEGERPVAGATVRSASGATATTDAEGRFQLVGSTPGVVEVEVSAAGFRAAREAVHVPPGGEAELNLRLERATLPALASVRGEVRGAGRALANVRIQLEGAQAEVRTAEDGTFELRVPEGRYQLRITAERFVPQTKEILVEVGQQALFYVELAPRLEP